MKGQRNSSVELFRILATFLVLIVHLNGWMAGGLVDWNDSNISTLHKISQLIIQSLSVVCVNCFLIISGWYGLKLKFASVWKMWILLLSIYVPFYLFDCFLGGAAFSPVTLVKKILAFPCESYFVQNYLILLFISPVLNAFIVKDESHLTIFALALFTIEVVMESVFQNKCLYIENGYSLFHFVTMYMLARAASIHKEKIMKVRKLWWVIGYFLCAALLCLLYFTPYKHTWAYSNPVIILESFMLFFPFLYRTFYNKFINRVAGGAFAVYIIQVPDPVCGKLFALDQYALSNFTYSTYLFLMLLFCVIFYIFCMIYNAIMQSILIPFTKPLGNYIEK
jgi:hypothetical protein